MPRPRGLPRPPVRRRFDSSLAVINVILMLIFFFLATGQVGADRDLLVKPPVTTSLAAGELPAPLLELRPDGTLRLDGAPVASDDLARAVASLEVLHVLMGRDAPASLLAELLGWIGRPDLEVRLVTRHLAPDQGR